MALQVFFDHAQKRVQDDRLGVSAGGDELQEFPNNDVWIDPITKTLMLRPAPLRSSWYTSDTGDYAKLGLADFGLSGSVWEVRQSQHAAGPWLCIKDASTNAAALSSSSYAKNRGFWVSWFSYGAGDVFLQMRCGWNSTASIAGGVGVEVYSDGTVLVYKGGSVVGQGKLTGGASPGAKANQVMEMMLLPMRQRELLVYGNGDGFVTLFEDIDEDSTTPEITPASKFWFEIVNGATQVQVAPLVFPSTGVASSVKMSLLEPPAVGEALESFGNDSWFTSPANYKIYGHPGFSTGTQTASMSLTEWDGTAFVADGSIDQCRLRTTLSTTNTGFTPFIYGGQMGYGGAVANTDDSEQFDATDSVLEVGFVVPDSADGVSATIRARNPVELGASVANLTGGCNRPILITLDEKGIIDGIGEAPGYSVTANEETDRIVINLRDRWEALESYTFRDRVPLDGSSLDVVLKFLARRGGFESADCSVTTTSFDLPFQPSRICGEWGTMIEPGDSAADWIHRLITTYAPNWFYGIRPTLTGAQFYAHDETDLGTTPAATLYGTVAAAELAGLTGDDAKLAVFRALDRAVIEPIANDVRVTGQNPRTGRPIMAHKADSSSSDPSLAPSLRPDNWLGFKRPYGLVSPEITTEAAAVYACNLIYDRYTQVQEVASWNSSLVLDGDGIPVWRGGNIELDGIGVFRVLSMQCELIRYVEGETPVSNCNYTGVKIA